MSAYFKTVFRSIKGSLARFIAIFAIIALGVGFFGGLKQTMPSFVVTGNTYVNDSRLFDFRLISTIGFDEEDIDKLSKVPDVKYVEGAVFHDVVVENSINPETHNTVRIHSITNNVNILKVTAGRLPEADNEVVLDGYRFDESAIGKRLTIADENLSSDKEAFKVFEFTVVGIVRSPIYMNFVRGNTDVGKGNLDYYVFAPKEAFDFEYYTEAYVSYDTGYEIYSDEYDSFIDSHKDAMEKALDEIINTRFQDMMNEHYGDLYDAVDTYEEARLDAAKELEDAQIELSDAREELLDAAQTLKDSKEQLDDARTELNRAQDQISSGESQLRSSERELSSGRSQLESSRKELELAVSQLNAGLNEANVAKNNLQSQLDEANAGLSTINLTISDLNSQKDALEMAMENNPELDYTSQIEQINQTIAGLNSQKEEVQSGISQLNQGISQVNQTINTLNSQLSECNAGLSLISQKENELRAGQAQYDAASNTLNQARRDYRNGLNQYNDGVNEYHEGMEKYTAGLKEYRDGLREYFEGKSEFVNEMGRVNRELYSAFKILGDIKAPDTYVLGRDTNIGYVSFDTDSQIVDGIANVFPVFFFAIAALVCSTTMSRMVQDERTQIGSMRAMGYTEFAIIMKYVIYSMSASVLGCVLGYLGGIRLFPYVIWQVYGMMYGFSGVIYSSSWVVFLISFTVSILCSAGVTTATCISEMKGTPAQLIRPKSPAAGKRILLERIPFIWKRMKFLYKVSARNVFRFKKRMFMMILGIAGCTSLLITGFGIRDSINDIVNIQFNNVTTYDISVVYEDYCSEKYIKDSLEEAAGINGSDIAYSIGRTENIKHTGEDTIRDVNLVISDDPNIVNNWHNISLDGSEERPWPGDGEIAISYKLSRSTGIGPGDLITFGYGDEGKTFTVKVAYVFENYIYHYAYMNSNTYEQCFGKAYKANQAFVSYLGDDGEEMSLAAYISNNYDVTGWNVTSIMRDNFKETMEQLNSVVILVICCAAALAFIVLFNLNNINISERIREISTLKVMGFNKGETGAYVFRENFILVLLGFVPGIPLGIALHAFVMSQIEMDTVTFVVQVLPISYVFSLLFVILFSVIVDVIMRQKIEKIDMAESLKSIE